MAITKSAYLVSAIDVLKSGRSLFGSARTLGHSGAGPQRRTVFAPGGILSRYQTQPRKPSLVNYLPSERELGAIAHRGRDIERADDELLHLGAGQRFKLDIGAL